MKDIDCSLALKKRTKIVCTLGPATHSVEKITELIQAGMNVARLNFSHGDYDDHAEMLANVRTASERLGILVGILQDLQGPRIRLVKLPEPYTIAVGDELVLSTNKEVVFPEKIGLTYPLLHEDVKEGHHILIADGTIELRVLGVEGQDISCVVEVAGGGVLESNKGLNIPEAELSLSTLTEKDKKDLVWGVQQGVDYMAFSFVRGPEDVRELRGLLHEAVLTVGGNSFVPHIISKIERREGVEHLAEIVEEGSGIMVARGDLGIEIAPSRVPIVQRDAIELCLQHAKPCIVATQMLDSMIKAPIPTRAEVSDIAHAAMDHTDAVMLSGETSVGAYPVEAVSIMAQTAREVEFSSYDILSLTNVSSRIHDVAFDTARSTAELAAKLDIKAIIVATDTGLSARLLSRFRAEVPIIAVTSSGTVQRQLALIWGVIPHLLHCYGVCDVRDHEEQVFKKFDFLNPKDHVLVVSSTDKNNPDAIDRVTVRIV